LLEPPETNAVTLLIVGETVPLYRAIEYAPPPVFSTVSELKEELFAPEIIAEDELLPVLIGPVNVVTFSPLPTISTYDFIFRVCVTV
jgi:hypothetical protein